MSHPIPPHWNPNLSKDRSIFSDYFIFVQDLCRKTVSNWLIIKRQINKIKLTKKTGVKTQREYLLHNHRHEGG